MSVLYPRTFRVGSTANFVWSAPEAIDSGAGVSLSVGAYSVAMSQPVADIAINAGGVNTDRTVLTAAAPPAIPTDFLKFGDAYLVTGEGESFLVRVLRVDGTSILLANPLPTNAPLTAASTLQFTLWSAPIGPGNVTAAANYQGIEWSTAHTRELPGDLVADQGLVRVVRVVWQSGLTDANFVNTFPEFQNRGHREDSYQPQIDAMYGELSSRIATDVSAYRTDAGERVTVDDVASQNAALQIVHGYMVAGKIAATRGDFETFEHYLTQAFGPVSSVTLRRDTGAYAHAMRPIWVDLNRDGVVDDGEVEEVTGPGPGFVASGFPTTPRVSATRQR